MTKYCVDCKHYSPLAFDGESFAKCLASVRDDEEVNLVTGVKPPKRYGYCDFERKETYTCGPNGTNFEPKEGDDDK